ncbi:hypothetical protein L7F22_044729 [Adiantum nelumboides]|nr:hypothetical protein [Adiantum nelumboides]
MGVRKLYATIDFGTARVVRTRPVKYASSNPMWNQSFYVYCAYEANCVTIQVKDKMTTGTVVIGKGLLPLSPLLSGKLMEGWFCTFDPQNPSKYRGKIFIKLDFHEIKSDPSWGQGIKGCDVPGVHYTFFKQETGKYRGKIFIKLDFHEIKSDPSWGQGIKGCDVPGVHYTFFKQETGNAVTLYQDSHVRNQFTPRISIGQGESYEPKRCWEDMYKALSEAKHLIYIAGWSVYTKITLVRDMDRPIPGAQGVTLGELLKHKAMEGVRVLLLVWDERTLIPRVEVTGVMHTHDEDTAAYFRGTKVHCVRCPRNPDDGSSIVKGMEVRLMFTHHQKTVIVDVAILAENTMQCKLVSFLGGIDLCDGRFDNQDHSLFSTLDTLHKEDFRQTNFEVDGFPQNPSFAAQMGLVSGKENIIDRSIQDAYICAIRRAKHFIYMENQYFVGSSASWSSHQDAGAIQLIPMGLTQKIISKIEAGERFAVYVVIPMWPEGVPESATVQAILYWQRLTTELMYKRIAAALKKKKMDGAALPTDYLNFFCLGNREAPNPREYKPSETPKSDDYRNAQKHRRFIIYVHANTMIVDDEYIIVGSANCCDQWTEPGIRK